MKIAAVLISLLFLAPHGALADNETSTEVKKSTLGDTVASVRAKASELIVQAMGLVGVTYKYGGNSPESGFDCSGFVSHVFKEASGIILPHNAYQMSLVGQRISSKELQPGDLVFFNTLKRAFSHVGIYIGDNKFIHSPSPGRAVEVVDMKDSYWTKRFQGARRISAINSTQAPTPFVPQTSYSDIPEPELPSKLY